MGGLFLNIMSVFLRRQDTTAILSRKCPFSMVQGQNSAKGLIVVFEQGRLTVYKVYAPDVSTHCEDDRDL